MDPADASEHLLAPLANEPPSGERAPGDSPAPAAAPPPVLRNIYGFSAFNAISFQMVLGSPMVLYAKSLNASATTLGIIAGMLPLLVVFQIPAARFVDAIGYKRFVHAGWSIRIIFVLLLMLTPLTAGWLAPQSRLALVLLLLFLFNLVRGISSCGWLPWITSIIPEATRGKFLTRDVAVNNLGSLVAFAIAAYLLGADPAAWRFSLLFGVSATAGVISVLFLARIPEEEHEHRRRSSAPPRPLREMLSLKPFRRLLAMNIAWALASGGVGTFAVAFLKEMSTLPERSILMVFSATFVGGMCTFLLLARLLDRLGSKPVLTAATLLWVLILAGWTLVAGGILPNTIPAVTAHMFFMGLGGCIVNLSNLRLTMISVPESGRSYFFAVFSVIGSMSLGLSPILWGIFIDGFRPLVRSLGAFEFNCYSLLFLFLAGMFALTALLTRRLVEGTAGSTEEVMCDVLDRSRARYWLRFWFRSWPRP